MAREDPRDALVSRRCRSLSELSPASVVGTSSLRREAQLRERYPQLAVKPLRGNVNTRLDKLDAGQYAAIILAAAGLTAPGLAPSIAALLDPADSLPGDRSGRAGARVPHRSRRRASPRWRRSPMHATTRATTAERAFGRVLAGNCRTPLAAYATGPRPAIVAARACRQPRWQPGACAASAPQRPAPSRRQQRSVTRSAPNSCNAAPPRCWRRDMTDCRRTAARRGHRDHAPRAAGRPAGAADRRASAARR